MSFASQLRKLIFVTPAQPKCLAISYAARPLLFKQSEARSSWLFASARRLQSTEPAVEESKEEKEAGASETSSNVDPSAVKGRKVQQQSVETSIRYLKSKAYSITYGNDPVWKNYRRNHKGSIPPRLTRKTCVRGGTISTGNPCPICRDDYLVLEPENVQLLNQFISSHSGEILSYRTTGLCQRKHKLLLSAIDIAKDRGLISFDVPFRKYDYSEYMKKC